MAFLLETFMNQLHGNLPGRPRQDNSEEVAGLDDSDELPIDPDEDMSVIPDEERVINVPS